MELLQTLRSFLLGLESVLGLILAPFLIFLFLLYLPYRTAADAAERHADWKTSAIRASKVVVAIAFAFALLEGCDCLEFDPMYGACLDVELNWVGIERRLRIFVSTVVGLAIPVSVGIWKGHRDSGQEA